MSLRGRRVRIVRRGLEGRVLRDYGRGRLDIALDGQRELFRRMFESDCEIEVL